MPSDELPPPTVPPGTPPPATPDPLPPPSGPSLPDGPDGPAVPAEPPRRLHPFTMIRGIPLRALGQVVPALAVGLAQLGGRSVAVILGLLLLVAVVGGIVRVLAWQRHTYELTGDLVVERRGVLNRRERTVQVERLQQVEVDQRLLDRLAGTAVLRLETASDASEPELELTVVALEEAHRLRETLLRRPGVTAAAERPRRTLVEVPIAHVAIASVTGRQLLFVPVIIAAIVGTLGEFGGIDEGQDIAAGFLADAGILILGLVGLLVVAISIVAALVMGVLRDGGFRIVEVGDDLVVTRGLLATREAVVPRSRIQKTTVDRGWVRRRLGFASLTLHSAGGDGSSPGESNLAADRRLTVPLVPGADALPLLHTLVPGLGELPPLRPHPAAARRRARVRYVIASLPALPILASFAFAVSGAVAPTVVTVALGTVLLGAWAWRLGALDHGNRASAITGDVVVSRSGALAISEAVSPTAKAQGVRTSTTPFQRRLDLASVSVHIAGPGRAVTVHDLGRADAATAARLVQRWELAPEPVDTLEAPPGAGPRER